MCDEMELARVAERGKTAMLAVWAPSIPGRQGPLQLRGRRLRELQLERDKS